MVQKVGSSNPGLGQFATEKLAVNPAVNVKPFSKRKEIRPVTTTAPTATKLWESFTFTLYSFA